jgi:hypothetical protein
MVAIANPLTIGVNSFNIEALFCISACRAAVVVYVPLLIKLPAKTFDVVLQINHAVS